MACTVLHADAFEDNYIWLVAANRPDKGTERPAVIIDPGDEDPVFDLIKKEKLTPIAVMCTHHHWDHVGGAADIADRFDIPVYGPADENISAISNPVTDGDSVSFPELQLEFQVLGVPGHTRGHVAYYAPGMLFCGDTLFSAGCGRLFEGTAEQMLDSLTRLAALPDDTHVYCAHEYTAGNLRFALAVEPDNPDVKKRKEEVGRLLKQNLPSLPSRIDTEKLTNPFLRADQAEVRHAAEAHTKLSLNDELAVFTELRRWKDHFRG